MKFMNDSGDWWDWTMRLVLVGVVVFLVAGFVSLAWMMYHGVPME